MGRPGIIPFLFIFHLSFSFFFLTFPKAFFNMRFVHFISELVERSFIFVLSLTNSINGFQAAEFPS
jgi:hypothetical protein